ncbi:MAG: S24/S26 family peptidase [Gemmatimonadales bacterium]
MVAPEGAWLGPERAEDRLRAAAPLLQRAGNEVESVLRGWSMGSTIPDGSRVRIQCGDPDGCERGDVVAIQAGPQLVIHRIVARGRRMAARNYVLTRGDARWWMDPPVAVASILGIVTAVEREDVWSPPRPPVGSPGRRFLRAIPCLMLRLALEVSVPLALALGRLSNAAWLARRRLRTWLGALRSG